MEKEKIIKKEEINKERRYILIGIVTMFSLFKISKSLTINNTKKKSVGTVVLVNALWKIMSLIRFILKV